MVRCNRRCGALQPSRITPPPLALLGAWLLVSEAERGALSPALRPGPARRRLERERVTGPPRPLSGVGRRDRGVDQPVGEQGVVGLLGGLVALLGLLIRLLGGLVALLSAGMLGLPHLALAVKLGLTALGLLLKALLALCCLAFALPGRGQLSFEGPSALPQARETSQIAELIGELLAVGGGVVGLPGRVLSIAERAWGNWGSRGMVAIARAAWSRSGVSAAPISGALRRCRRSSAGTGSPDRGQLVLHHGATLVVCRPSIHVCL